MTREGLIDLHQLFSVNAVSVALNPRGGRHGQLFLKITSKEYKTQTGFAFIPLHNHGGYPQSMGNSQEQALRTEKFRQNQALFLKYTPMDGAFKKQIVTAVEPVFLSSLVEQLTGF